VGADEKEQQEAIAQRHLLRVQLTVRLPPTFARSPNGAAPQPLADAKLRASVNDPHSQSWETLLRRIAQLCWWLSPPTTFAAAVQLNPDAKIAHVCARDVPRPLPQTLARTLVRAQSSLLPVNPQYFS
jgi:hypothetical protein